MSEFHRKCELLMKFVKEPYEKRKEEAGKSPRAYYAKCCIHSAINEGKILYESEEGSGMSGNLLAIFLELMERPEALSYEHIWSMESEEKMDYYKARWGENKNVTFVIRGSKEYVKVLAECKYLLNDKTFPSYFMKRKGQVYLNVWHGMPIKKVGYECNEGEKKSANQIRNFLSADYLISSGSYLTKVYEDAFLLKGLYPGKIVTAGMPRTDLLFSYDREAIYEEMRTHDVLVDPEKELILYIPDVHGEGKKAMDRSLEFATTYKKLVKGLSGSHYQVLIRPAPSEYRMLSETERKKGYYIPDTMEAEPVLGLSDIVITDSSELVFSYLLMERPIIFYRPQLRMEKKRQNMRLLEEELPGPVVDKLEAVLWWIRNKKELIKSYEKKIKTARVRFCSYEDGQSAARVADLLLGEEIETEKEEEIQEPDKKKLLFYAGALKTNGITVSLLGLLELLDVKKYDITVYIQPKNEETSVFSAKDFKKGIRILVRVPKYNATSSEEFYHGMISEVGVYRPFCKQNYPSGLYEREFRRCFGEARFDEVIDYSGYGSFMARVLLASPYGKKRIWQHSDMKRDQKRKVEGEYPFDTELKVVFSLYDRFDSIVSCGKDVMEVNRAALATEETYDTFTYVDNPVSIGRILMGLKEEQVIKRLGKTYLVLEGSEQGNVYYANKMIPLPEKEHLTFVMIGRLSPEKNPLNAVKAFEEFLKKEEEARLYLIGDGPLAEDIKRYITRHRLTDAICLTGNLANPFPLLRHCGCFLLPSKWEGQAMTVWEIRVLKKPILLSDYKGYEGACKEDGQKVIHTDVASIYDGMVAYANGEISVSDWDYETYNEQVKDQFESLIKSEETETVWEGE